MTNNINQHQTASLADLELTPQQAEQAKAGATWEAKAPAVADIVISKDLD